jgi:hypothetical protein
MVSHITLDVDSRMNLRAKFFQLKHKQNMFNGKISWMLGLLLMTLPAAAEPKNNLLEKLASLRVSNNQVSVGDVESLFPELVSSQFALEQLGAKQGVKRTEIKSVNHSKLLMLILDAICQKEGLKVSNDASLLASVKRGDIKFREAAISTTETKFAEQVSPKSAPRMSVSVKTESAIQTDVAALAARFPELVASKFYQVPQTKGSPKMIEEKSANVERIAAKLLEELQAEAKHNSIAGL